MEIGLKVMAEDTYQNTQFHAASAYFTLIATNELGQKCLVPEIEPQTDEEIRRWREAEIRRNNRRSHNISDNKELKKNDK